MGAVHEKGGAEETHERLAADREETGYLLVGGSVSPGVFGERAHNFPYTDLPPLGDMVLDQEALSGGEKPPSENLWDVMEDYSGHPETSGKLL